MELILDIWNHDKFWKKWHNYECVPPWNGGNYRLLVWDEISWRLVQRIIIISWSQWSWKYDSVKIMHQELKTSRKCGNLWSLFANPVTNWVASTAGALLYKKKSSTLPTTTIGNLNNLAHQRKKRKKEKHFCQLSGLLLLWCFFTPLDNHVGGHENTWRWINVVIEVYMLPFLRFWEFLFVLPYIMCQCYPYI